MTAEEIAEKKGYKDIVKILHDFTAWSGIDKPLHKAAQKGDLKEVQALIAQKADVNATGKWSQPPLMIAVAGGHVDIVKILIEAGADVNKQNIVGCSPLFSAISHFNKDIMQILLDHEAHVMHEMLANKPVTHSRRKRYSRSSKIAPEIRRRCFFAYQRAQCAFPLHDSWKKLHKIQVTNALPIFLHEKNDNQP